MNQLENAFFSKKEKTMSKVKKAFWFCLGIILVGVAYLGVLLPGLPWSTPILGATFCFAKSSDRLHNWIMNHPRFGPFVKNWGTYRVYPTAAKWLIWQNRMLHLELVLTKVDRVVIHQDMPHLPK
jgi:uncharacterized membrane protein YbaN (DUF454 family)